MHCVDPSCVSVCMMGALHKEGEGKRTRGERRARHRPLRQGLCVGCRYCQIGCAFNVPKFEWYDGVPAHREVRAVPAPRRPEGAARSRREPGLLRGVPARRGRVRQARASCSPRRSGASPRSPDALRARRCTARRTAAGPRCSTSPRRASRSSELGLPALAERSAAEFSESVSHAPYLHGVTPIALYAGDGVRDRPEQEEGKPPSTAGRASR